jgi:hypothetical protein
LLAKALGAFILCWFFSSVCFYFGRELHSLHGLLILFILYQDPPSNHCAQSISKKSSHPIVYLTTLILFKSVELLRVLNLGATPNLSFVLPNSSSIRRACKSNTSAVSGEIRYEYKLSVVKTFTGVSKIDPCDCIVRVSGLIWGSRLY